MNQFRLAWTIGGTSSPTFNTVTSSMWMSTNRGTVAPEYTGEVTYGAVAKSISSGTSAADVSLLYLFRKAAEAKTWIKIQRIRVTGGFGAATGASIRVGIRGISAENGTPGGTAVVGQPYNPDDAASVLASTNGTIIAGATGNPTAISNSEFHNEEMMSLTTVALITSPLDWCPSEHGKPLLLRPGKAEGIEVYCHPSGTLSTAANMTVSILWTESLNN